MTEEIMALCRAMGATEDQEGLLLPLAQASAQALERRLKPGTSPGLCGPAFPLAAAMLAMDGLERAVGSGRVSSFTAGELSIRMGGTAGEGGLRAFLQPVLDREREQRLPSPLGQRPEDRYLYLGPADIPLEAGRSQVEWKDRAFEVQSAHLVGDSHWWALLRPRDREAT